MDTRCFVFAKHVGRPERTRRGVQFPLDNDELLGIDILRDDLLRLRISRNREFDARPTFAVCAELPESAQFSTEFRGETVEIATAALKLIIHRNPFSLAAYRADGSPIFESHSVGDMGALAYGMLNDGFMVARKRQPADRFFGLGQKTGDCDRSGRSFVLWNTDVLSSGATREFIQAREPDDPARDPSSTLFDPYYISIPFFHHLNVHSKAVAGFFIDNGHRATFDLSASDHFGFHFHGGQYTEYIFAGPRMSDVLSAYAWLTGTMELPPLWSLGHHQCRWYSYDSRSLMDLARRYRQRRIPCDALWLDIDYMDGYRVFTWDQERFSDPAGMVDELQEQGFRTVTIIDPGVKMEHGYPVYDGGIRGQHFCRTEEGAVFTGQVWPGRTAFPDFPQPRTRDWWAGHIARHLQSGVDGIWLDMNEPATGNIDSSAMRFDGGRQPHGRYHNQYALLMAMGTKSGMETARPGHRHFALSRAGFAGIQRFAANWLGDNFSRWEHLRMGLSMALGLGISGQPFVGADVGGFAENASPELLARWYQYGALTPFFRNHACAGTVDQYPWSFGDEVERQCRAAVQLRYRLLPYIYSAFREACEIGTPVQRPLVYSFQGDTRTWEVEDQYMLGNHLLVAPVGEPGMDTRPVYLPQGTWHAWHTGQVCSGGCLTEADSPAGYIPLYARGGAVIPAWAQAPLSTMGWFPGSVDLHIFVPKEDGETHSTLYEDDGMTLAYRTGAFLLTSFVLRREGSHIYLRTETSGSGFPESRRKQFRLVFHGPLRPEIVLNGRKAQLGNGTITVARLSDSLPLSISMRAQTEIPPDSV